MLRRNSCGATIKANYHKYKNVPKRATIGHPQKIEAHRGRAMHVPIA